MSDAHAVERVRAILAILRDDPRAVFVSKETALLMITDAIDGPLVIAAEEAEMRERGLL